MSSPLKDDSLPLLLVGPILRRVESDLVCVWVATSRPCEVSIRLFLGSDVLAPQNALDEDGAPWVSRAQPTIAIGARFHAIAATLDLRVPGGNAFRANGPLRAHLDYSYDIRLAPRDGSAPQNLRTLGLVNGDLPLGYNSDELPGFRVSPDERDQLVILHGSCRRMFAEPPLADDPPGGWLPRKDGGPDDEPDDFPGDEYPALPRRDGFLWIDALIDPRGLLPRIEERPHQLFLTGDQIYADDVPAVLLPALNRVGKVLIGPEELPTSLPADENDLSGVPAPADLKNFPPGFRKKLAIETAGFTTTDGESHLFTFGEFIAYYVLTWSPSLWAFDLWPPEFKTSDVPPGIDEVEWKRIAAKFWTPELFEWWMRRFSSGLQRVRRALANVPTYMLADDHEITDDWYLSRKWRDGVFTRPLGVATIRNGLMAYSVMQAWGNDPRRWAAGPERELLGRIGAWTALQAGARHDSDVEKRLHELLGLPFQPASPPPPNAQPAFRPLVQYSYQIEGPCHRVLVIDGRTRRRFPTRNAQAGGIDYEGPSGLFGDSPMAEALPPPPDGDRKLTLVVTGVPVLGPEGMEAVLLPLQRLTRTLLDVDAEAWSYEPATFEALLFALARYGSVVLLSGDIHLGCTAVLDYWSAPANQPVRTTARIVQLISSGLTQDWGKRTPALKANALMHDILEQGTTTSDPSERIGWGTPVRMTLAPPPPPLDDSVKVTKGVAHPSYRARLKMRAPVVPTVGWPANSEEARTPNWAWRMWMVRDERDESDTPTIDKRWTPVTIPAEPFSPENAGWHSNAARRQAYGRVFSFQPNVGIVTFEKNDDATTWSVRHVLAGELPLLPGTGAPPAGLQPYVVHRASLAPPALDKFDAERPKLRADGGWGADETDPSLLFLLHWLPLIWRAAAGQIDPLWPDLPLDADEAARDRAISAAADRLAGKTFRRRILRELGPYAEMTDALDDITDARIEDLIHQVGQLDVLAEARALVRPDLERLMNLHTATTDRAAFLDDALLIACSDWINERNRFVSLVAGFLATFRSPLTKHVPVLSQVLEGLWDLWRNQTHVDHWMKGASPPVWLAGLVSAIPRAVEFACRLVFVELAYNLVEDRDPRPRPKPHGAPVLMPPELALAAAGAVLSMELPKRFLTASGWETGATLERAGARRGDSSPEGLARQTLSLMMYPDGNARFVAPPQRLSITLVPPRPPPADAAGTLSIAWDAALRVETEIGAGLRLRLGTESGAAAGGVGAKATIAVLRPTTWSPGGGIEIRFTPSIAIGFGIASGAAGLTRGLELRLSLNDEEDRVSFIPKSDGFLAQFLPTDGIALPLDAAWTWDTNQENPQLSGLAVIAQPPAEARPAGTPSKKASAVTPMNKKLGILTLHDRSLDLGYDGEGDGVTIKGKIAGTVSLNLGPVRIAVSGLGVEARLHISGDPIHDDDPFDFSIDPATPTGLALSVDGDIVSGGGFLQRIESPGGAVTWRGAVSLHLTKRFTIAGYGLVETGGGRHWSLLAFVYGRFTPAIQLPAGLRLVAVGGMLGLHRSMNTDALRDAATGTRGNLDALLMPEHPEQRFLELIPAANAFFPATTRRHVAGLLAELEWGATKTKVNGRIRAALLVQIGDVKAALYGTLQLGFPTLATDHVLRLRASLEALYDHANQFARFSLTITEALLFETVRLTGGAALLIRWGARDEWAFTIGGFHPKFRPFIPAGLIEPPRLGAHWHPVDAVDLDLQAYAAITSTSIQFGASAYLVAGTDWGGVKGNIGFNFLIMFEPSLHFEADLSFRITAFLFGLDLISVRLSALIKGPGPWIFEGTVSWEVCGADISKHVGPYQWGDEDHTPARREEARQLLGDALEDPSNWSVRRGRRRLAVRVRAGSDNLLDARDTVDVRQSVLPLGTPLEVHDRNELSDAGIWRLAPATGTLAKIEDIRDVFPRRRYERKPPKERPFQDDLACGARFGNTGWDARLELAVKSEENATEDLVLDSLPAPTRRIRFDERLLLADAVLVAAPARAPERSWTRHIASSFEGAIS